MGNNIGSAVNKGITKELFQASLKANGVKADSDKYKNAMTIFDKYASMGGDANTLEEDEQVMARADFAQLNKDDDNNVGKREYNKNGGKDAFGTDYNAATAYMKAMESAASLSNDKAGEMSITDDGAVVTYGANTEDTSDDVVNVYTKGADGNYTKSELEAETVPDEAPAPEVPEEGEGSAPEQPVTPSFKNDAALKNNVVKYLLGMGEDEAVNAEVNLGENFECSVDDNGKATVKFNGKEYTARINSDGKLVFENDEGDGTTLQQAVLNSESTDAENHYYNRGRKGNLKSTYDAEKGEITNNSGKGRQGVSQTQTLSSMIMNNNESSSLRLDGQVQADGTRKALDGQTIIDSIDTSDDGSKGEITKSELIKYLSAAVKEANATVEAAKPGAPGGSRIYAPNVDLDLKDLANIGIVFDAMDRDGNGKLNAGELDELIAKLTSGQTMSSIAGKSGTYKYEGPAKAPEKKPEAPKPPKEDKPFKMEYGEVAKADKTRKNTSGGSVTYTYSGGTKGMRTMVADDGTGKTRIVKNANVAEYDDHGLLGMGKKEFLVIQGLEQNVRAEVVSGKAQGPMVIEVKDANGNKSYRQVSYDEKTSTYSQGAQVYKNKAGQYKTSDEIKSEGLKTLGFPEKSKLPKGFSFGYDKKGELVCQFKGAVVKPNVAKVMIMKVNAEKTESSNDNPVNTTPVNQTPVDDQPVDEVPDGTPPVNNPPVDTVPEGNPVDDTPPVVNNTPVKTSPVVDKTPGEKPRVTGPMNDEQVEQYKVNDKNYQNRKRIVASWDRGMKALEEKYGFKRSDGLLGQIRMNTQDYLKYSELNGYMLFYGDNFEAKFTNVLKNWVDTPAGKDGDNIEVNGNLFHDVKKETLPDGTKAYHAKEGYFNLYFDGNIGDKMSEEELKQHGVQ